MSDFRGRKTLKGGVYFPGSRKENSRETGRKKSREIPGREFPGANPSTNLILGSHNFGTVLATTHPILDGIEQTLHQWKQLGILYPGVPKKLENYYDVIGEFPEKNRKNFRKIFSEKFI